MKSNKDVKEAVKTLCEKYDVDFSKYVIGYGKTYNKKTNRYVFDATSQYPLGNSKFEFAIKYISDDDIYLVWNIRKLKRNIFSVLRMDVQTAIEGNRKSTQKAVEYQSWGEETVLILTAEQFEQFIKDGRKSHEAIGL